MKIVCIIIWITEIQEKSTTFITFILVEDTLLDPYKQLPPSNGFPHSPFSWSEFPFFLKGVGYQCRHKKKWRV